MTFSKQDFDKKLYKKLSANVIPSKRTTTPLPIPRYSSCDELLISLLSNTIPYQYTLLNQLINEKGVEIRPIHTDIIYSIAQRDTKVAEQLMSFNKMCSCGVFKHNAVPLHTVTSRTTHFGPSLTSLKKKFWPYTLDPVHGYLYVLLDYCQQEPTIAACFAGDLTLLDACQQGDLYQYIGSHPDLDGIDRGTIKKLVLSYSYGQFAKAYAKEHGIPLAVAQRYWKALREIFQSVDRELNHRSQLAFRDGFVSGLDWAAFITPLSNPLAVRAYPVQAAGADIMRRAVIGLAEAGIDLRLTIHDAFLIRVPIAEQELQVAKAIAVLKQASALVLGGFELNVKIDGVFDGQAEVM